jgi:hypothetical protein
MFIHRTRNPEETVMNRRHPGDMADLFAIVGIVAISLLGVARWWEEH